MQLDEIGQIIRNARKNQQLTQAQLSASLGMSRATLSAIENGTVPEIGIRKILSILRCLRFGIKRSTKIQTSDLTTTDLRK